MGVQPSGPPVTPFPPPESTPCAEKPIDPVPAPEESDGEPNFSEPQEDDL